MKNIKVLLILSLILITAYSYSIEVSASTKEQKIYDFADLLTSEEEEQLQERSLSVGKQVETDILVVTIDDAEGKSAMAYADDFYDNGAYGYEQPYGTGILLLIDMDNREAWISTSGEAIDHFSEARINATLDDVFMYLPEGDYYNSALVFIENVEEYMVSLPSSSNKNEYNPDTYPDTNFYYDKEESILRNPLICLLIGVLVGGVSILIMVSRAKSRMTVGGNTYVEPGSFHVNSRRDTFLRTSTVTRRIESNNNSGGGFSGGGRHTSSGGRSHGGGGRKF